MKHSAQGPSVYAGHRAAFATMHGKARAVSLPFKLGLGLELEVPLDLDTDQLGSFSGEIERTGTPFEVAVRKARLGMAALGLPLGLASEGSFGSHPVAAFIPAHHELLVFVDDARGIVVAESNLTMTTNYAQLETGDLIETRVFLERVLFPSHAVIVRPAGTLEPGAIWKGLRSIESLETAFEAARSRSVEGRVQLETDMRAHVNPTRQRVIRRLGLRLACRLRSRCPACDAPGWGVVGVVRGLPCGWCGTPTDRVRLEVWGCADCDERLEFPARNAPDVAAPDQCPNCNP